MIKEQFPPAQQWEIYKFRTSHKENEGTEIMKSRPGIIISTNELNKWGSRYIFLSITSKKFEQVYPFEILINFGIYVVNYTKIISLFLNLF